MTPQPATVASAAQRDGEQQEHQQDGAPEPHPDAKVMPVRYETCDVKDLGVLISDMLMELVRLNDALPLQDGQLTRFHSRYVPAQPVPATQRAP